MNALAWLLTLPALMHRNRSTPFTLWLTLLVCMPAAAAPNGDDLLSACRTALGNGFNGHAAAMCIWYVPPCDCLAKNDAPEPPEWCGPEQSNVESLAPALVKQLEMHPELAGMTAADAAAQALALAYPCPSN